MIYKKKQYECASIVCESLFMNKIQKLNSFWFDLVVYSPEIGWVVCNHGVTLVHDLKRQLVCIKIVLTYLWNCVEVPGERDETFCFGPGVTIALWGNGGWYPGYAGMVARFAEGKVGRLDSTPGEGWIDEGYAPACCEGGGDDSHGYGIGKAEFKCLKINKQPQINENNAWFMST